MNYIRFLGASGTVTGSSYLLHEKDKQGILIDCGMFQGTKEIEALNQRPLEVEADEIKAVLLTHAHLDHCGRLPVLARKNYSGPIYMNEATLDLLQIVLYDAAKIQSYDKDKIAMYNEFDVDNILSRVKLINYNEPFFVDDVKVTYRDAGHILGSSFIELETPSRKIIFSGDLGNTPQDIVRPTERATNADVVIMESTYGGKTHPPERAIDILMQEILEVHKTGGVLLIPSFAIQRTQELLHMMHNLVSQGKIPSSIPIYLDSPMALNATHVYSNYRELYNDDFASEASQSNPFTFENLHAVERPKDSRLIGKINGAKVIIAGSGMMSGGKILGHATRYLPNPTTRLLLVGYMGDDTVGRYLSEGLNPVKIGEAIVHVKGHITHMRSMSAHVDHPKLMNWLRDIEGVKQVILTHGDNEPRVELENAVRTELNIQNTIRPLLNETHELTS